MPGETAPPPERPRRAGLLLLLGASFLLSLTFTVVSGDWSLHAHDLRLTREGRMVVGRVIRSQGSVTQMRGYASVSGHAVIQAEVAPQDFREFTLPKPMTEGRSIELWYLEADGSLELVAEVNQRLRLWPLTTSNTVLGVLWLGLVAMVALWRFKQRRGAAPQSAN
ncbi:MAG: hypothetical protein M5U26_24835 [Planctomycetota bacterium]|nr:hypothetical protein [Planctomycetota bacterium]